MLIYFAGPLEHMRDALLASQYSCTRPVLTVKEADALVLVWDGKDSEVKELMKRTMPEKLRFVYRTPDWE